MLGSAKIEGQNLILIAILLLAIGFLAGWLGFLMFGNIAKHCRVVFVSKEAIIKAEEERVKAALKDEANNDAAKSIFFGRTSEALSYIERITNSYSDRRTKVLFISNDSGLVRNGYGVSGVIHEEVIRVLSSKKATNEEH